MDASIHLLPIIDELLAKQATLRAENERLRAALTELLNYSGVADNALDDEYVVARAHWALAMEVKDD